MKNILFFSPINPKTLKDEFIERFESLILSGHFKPGEYVPSERELGEMFGVSRPVVHDGLRTLEHRGLVTIESRKGVKVNDYRKEGSIELLLSILNYSGMNLAPSFFDSLLEMRILFEVEAAGKAALRGTEQQIQELEEIIKREKALTRYLPIEFSTLDYQFHLSIALASGNEIFPLLLNSFKRIYMTILERFYTDDSTIPHIITLHESLAQSIKNHDEQKAKVDMEQILVYGEQHLRKQLSTASKK